jgi:hypothetical protein
MNKNNIINYEFIELYDKDILTDNEKGKFKDINDGTISLFLKHLYI